MMIAFGHLVVWHSHGYAQIAFGQPYRESFGIPQNASDTVKDMKGRPYGWAREAVIF